MNRRIGIVIGLVALGAAVFLYVRHRDNTTEQVWDDANIHDAVVSISRTSTLAIDVHVSIARTPAEQEQGLSGTPALPENSGKLFIFKTPGTYGFWMKDMEYSLDFIWIDAAHRIVAIDQNITPETYPTVFYPPHAIAAVLEVNGGFAQAHALRVGDTVTVRK